nr:immunoglobulin light chain junction region [Macaca mulatta]MOX28322.1 immunoglobulin light chain junction region [Macaca mulatta]MOX28437.1 immunoglobulin light chain junction region [Macaca mulatta]MOX28647.1 immunoglobulin light chain junction region [Macaca mulatta]MOX28902.1 immunoglobulin light chain junction region [Macaca mulatta]
DYYCQSYDSSLSSLLF